MVQTQIWRIAKVQKPISPKVPNVHPLQNEFAVALVAPVALEFGMRQWQKMCQRIFQESMDPPKN